MEFVPFAEVSNLLEHIRRAATPTLKVKVWQKYIDKFPETHKNQTTSFYPIIRLLLPKIDRERDSYGIQMATMGQLYIRAFNFAPKSTEAKALTTPQGFNSNTADYADVIYRVIKNRCPQKSSLSVADVNSHLDTIGNPLTKRPEVETVFMKIITSMTADEQKWIVRIILKKLNLGIAERRILNTYHPKAYLLYERMTYLSKVCELVDTGQADVVDDSDVVSLFQPLRPMLCEQAQLSRLPALFQQQNIYVEIKMDGERFQIHKEGNNYRYFSRNDEFTEKFGSRATGKTFSASLDRKFDSSVQSVILDGEMLVFDQVEKCFLSKGDNIDARNLKSSSNLLQVYCAFDLLFLNGESWLKKPYLERIRQLDKIIQADPHVVVICQRKAVNTVEEVLEFFNGAIDRNEEGIILKGQDSPYFPGQRNGSGWFKLKPDYVEGLVTDLDLLIVGATRNAKGFIESFIVAVAVKETVDDRGDPEENLSFQAVSTVKHGLNRQQWRDVNATLSPHWIRSEQYPHYIQFGNCKPHCWIEPKHSLILQVKATELNKSTSYRTEYTLRFPRITAIRSDKAWYDCGLLTEFQALSGNSDGRRVAKITKRHATVLDVSVKRGGKNRKTNISRTEPFFEDEIVKVDSICAGLEFCVLNTRKGTVSVRDLERIIKEHSGVVVKNPGPNTFLCVAGDLIATVLGYAKTQLYDIVNVEWVVGMLGGGKALQKLPPLKPLNMIAMKPETRQRLTKEFDCYNDSYVQDIQDNTELMNIFKAIPVKPFERLLERELIEFEETHFEDDQKKLGVHVNLFSNIRGYFSEGVPEYIKQVFRGRRGLVINDIDEATHVFVEKSIGQEVVRDVAEKRPKMLNCEFIIDCIRQGIILEESNFIFGSTLK